MTASRSASKASYSGHDSFLLSLPLAYPSYSLWDSNPRHLDFKSSPSSRWGKGAKRRDFVFRGARRPSTSIVPFEAVSYTKPLNNPDHSGRESNPMMFN